MSGDAWPWHEILRLPKFGAGPGLHRVAALTAPTLAGPWGGALDALKVTGSNGKGSVAALLAAALEELGLRPGRFTSPHLFRFEERIAIAGEPVEAPALDAAWETLRARLDTWEARHPGDQVGAFEAITALALETFARAGVDALVAEAGIGGRHDPTRVIPGRVAALVSLDLEHVPLLGHTLAEIACDKADLCPEGGTLVHAVEDGETRARLEAHCRERGVTALHALAASGVRRLAWEPPGMRLDLEVEGERWDDVALALRGEHQARNALVAILSLRAWLRARPAPPPRDAVEGALRRAMARVRWPLRFEQVHAAPDVFADVGHTPAALRALADSLRGAFPGRRLVLLTGVSLDKDARGILEALAPLAASAVVTQAHHKGRSPFEVAALLRRLRGDLPIEVEPDLAEAVPRALSLARLQGRKALIAGGLFLAAEATHALRGGDPRALRFF